MRRTSLSLILVLIIAASLSISASRTSAQAGDPWSLIAEVNALRASYGLTPYEVNNALMTAAQSHSEYMSGAGSVTHSGPGGSRPHDRAVAAGYGGGAQVYVSENIAMGVDLSPSGAVYNMWQDSLHLETMVSSRYREIGAGVAVSGDHVYYTIVVGFAAGSPGSGSSPPSSDPNSPPAAPAPTIAIIQPVQIATPRADGAVIHVVDDGQALWHLVEAYEVSLADLLAMNALTESSIIYPGDKLLVRPATQATSSSPLPTPSPTSDVPTPTPTRTRKPAASPTRTRPAPTLTSTAAQAALALAVTPQPSGDSSAPIAQTGPSQPAASPDYLLIAIGVLALSGLALILIGSLARRAT